jgi:hypothetical protein
MAGKVKAEDLKPGDKVSMTVKGEAQDVELMQVERAEFDGEDVVVLRFEVEGGVITRRVPPAEELSRGS